jgi:potassium-transporting ATPase KdpC subunit
MLKHIRANLLLLGTTLALCSVLYPLVLWVVGQAVFPEAAEGSLIKEKDGTVRGSHLIAQPFSGNEYFKPRPSAAGSGYDASASGGSNLAASNALLRGRVAQTLGPIVKYDPDDATNKQKGIAGKNVSEDVVKWFQKQPKDYALTWAKEHPKLAEQWVKDHSEAVANFLEKDAKEVNNKAGDYALPFFEAYVKKLVQDKPTWPTSADKKDGDKTVKVIEPVSEGEAVQRYFFDLWLRENEDAKLKKVPADMVTTSGSGLDPHITLANAHYQLDGVADEWAKTTKASREKVVEEIEKLLNEKKFSPGFGLFGEPMVNVLEVNLELRKRMADLK